jgi:uncharacterized membrane protein YhaH (DUF805 family)
MIVEGKRPLGFSLNGRSRRRGYVVVVLAFCAILCGAFLKHLARHGVEDFDGTMLFVTLSGITAMVGGVRADGPVKYFGRPRTALFPLQTGLRTLFGKQEKESTRGEIDLDEREQHERDREHYRAYVVVRRFALLLFAAYVALGWLHVRWFDRIGPFAVFLLVLMLWVLPQMLILWNEPDVEEQL